MRWMNLEPIIHSELSQKEKNKCYILTCVYMESRKMVLMNLFAGQQWKCRCREQTCWHRQGRRERDEWREQAGHVLTTACRIDSQWEFAGWLRELKPVLCDKLEGWAELRSGREAREGGTYVYLRWFMLVHPTLQSNYPSVTNRCMKKRN